MKIKVAMIGCGTITELRHAPEYKAIDNVEIVAFCDPLQARAEKMALKFGGDAFMDYREVLGITDLDAVSVCTSNNTHASITIEALKAGKHVLCEKPMATNLDDARAMIETAERCCRFLMIGHNQRFAEAHVKARKILQSGELGRILTFRTTFGHGGPEFWSMDKGRHTWFFKKDAASFGALADLGIHKADLIPWLIGDEIDEISACLSTRDKRNHLNELIEVEDNAICIMKTKSGILGNMNTSWTYYGAEDNSTVIYCEGGILKLFDHPDYQIIIEKKNGNTEFYKFGNIQTNALQTKSGVIDTFVESLTKGVKPEISGEEGYKALSIILACLESNKEKNFVKVKHYVEVEDLNYVV